MRASSGSAQLLQPLQQRLAQPADHPHLREVDVRVHEAGQQHAAAKVDRLVLGSRRPHLRERAAIHDDAVLNRDPGVGLGAQAAARERRLGRVEDGAAIDGHDAPRVDRREPRR